jgi:uncharacterized protein (DUF1501 family)
MDRREFAKLAGLGGIGSLITLSGIPTSLFAMPSAGLLSCAGVSDRVLVILRMAGANDGLNMCVPLTDFSTYESLRPNIKLKGVGLTNGVIRLDSTLSSDKDIGLHPAMSAIKDLYDSGKVRIVNAVGYPNFNYSHFGAEDILWGGVDGTHTGVIDTGMLGKYLDKVFPYLSGSPTGFFPDPLAIQLGNANPLLSYDHSHGTAEYNATSLQSYFNAHFAPMTIPAISDYGKKLDYIKSIELSASKYYNRVLSCFDSGSNSSVTYPNTDLGKQLRAIARLIKGGSKTKIFQCTIGGFDTHVSQVITGSTHTGEHATLLQNVSGSIDAFMKDINNLGFGDRVTMVTFSEFGRKPMENGSVGTDHGNISPLMVIGNLVNGGVEGKNPDLSKVSAAPDGRFFASEMQHDYRRVYASLLQDWLGGDSTVLTAAGIGAFASTKLPIITTASSAAPGCLSSTIELGCTDFGSVSEYPLTLKASSAGWDYYGKPGSPEYLLGIEKKPSGTGANTASFEIEILYSLLDCSPANIGCFKVSSGKEAMFASREFFNTKVPGAMKPNGWVNIRWFFDSDMLTKLNTAGADFKASSGAGSLSPVMWLKKTNSAMKLIKNLRTDGLGIHYAVEPMTFSTTGAVSGKAYYQFDQISRIDGTGAAAFTRVSDLSATDPKYDIPAATPTLKGGMRFNAVSGTFEGYDGSNWQPLH